MSIFYNDDLSSNTCKKGEKKNLQDILGIALISLWNQKKKESKGRALRKEGDSLQKRNETNGFEMLFDAGRLFSGD